MNRLAQHPPVAPGTRHISRVNHLLVVPKSEPCLPPRCVFCNAETPEPIIHLDLSSIHPDHREPPLPLRWVEFIHAAYAKLFHGQRATIGIRLCAQPRAELARGVLLQRILVLLLAGVFAGLAFVASPWLFLLSGLSLAILPFCRASDPIAVYLVTAEHIWLDGCGQPFLLSFPGSGTVERPDTEWPW